MAALLTRLIPDGVLAEPVFQPAYETEIKLRGVWTRTKKDLLKGYLIAISADPEALEKAISQVVEFARILRTSSGPAPLALEEVSLFGGLGSPGCRCLPMSRGYKTADGTVVISSGPLVGHEHLIARVNRHKCLAVLRLSVGGNAVQAFAGLSIAPEAELVANGAPLAFGAPRGAVA